MVCDSGGIRTPDPQLRRLLLYPTELPNRAQKARKGTAFFSIMQEKTYFLRFLLSFFRANCQKVVPNPACGKRLRDD